MRSYVKTPPGEGTLPAKSRSRVVPSLPAPKLLLL